MKSAPRSPYRNTKNVTSENFLSWQSSPEISPQTSPRYFSQARLKGEIESQRTIIPTYPAHNPCKQSFKRRILDNNKESWQFAKQEQKSINNYRNSCSPDNIIANSHPRSQPLTPRKTSKLTNPFYLGFEQGDIITGAQKSCSMNNLKRKQAVVKQPQLRQIHRDGRKNKSYLSASPTGLGGKIAHQSNKGVNRQYKNKSNIQSSPTGLGDRSKNPQKPSLKYDKLLKSEYLAGPGGIFPKSTPKPLPKKQNPIDAFKSQWNIAGQFR